MAHLKMLVGAASPRGPETHRLSAAPVLESGIRSSPKSSSMEAITCVAPARHSRLAHLIALGIAIPSWFGPHVTADRPLTETRWEHPTPRRKSPGLPPGCNPYCRMNPAC